MASRNNKVKSWNSTWVKENIWKISVDIVKAIVTYYKDRYSSLPSDDNNESSGISDDENMEISDGDSMLFYVCQRFGLNYRKVAKMMKIYRCS